MQSTKSENSSSDSENSLNDKVTVTKGSWRLGDDGKYNKKPLSESYFRDYYHEKIKSNS
jgi:hypothetical protein